MPSQVASGLFTTFHADTPDVERFAQVLSYRCLCFTSSAHVLGQKLLTCPRHLPLYKRATRPIPTFGSYRAQTPYSSRYYSEADW